MVKENRIEWVDLLKGIAILWLIVYHFYAIGWLRSPVPVFFFLSGLFFSEGKSFGAFICKKTKALIVPFLFFFALGVGGAVLKNFLSGEAYSFPQLWRFATLIPADAEKTNPLGVGAIWFLVSLFEIYIIYFAMRRVSTKGWWLLIVAILLFLLSAVTMRFYGNGALFYLFYTSGFVIYFVTANLLREKVLFKKISVWVPFLAICAYTVRFIDLPSLLDTSQIGGGVLLRIRGLVSMMGLIGILVWIVKFLSCIPSVRKRGIYKFLLFDGINSLTILGTHLLVMVTAAIFVKRFMTVGTVYYIVLFMIIVAASNVCILLFNRYVPFLVNHKSGKKGC